MRKLFLAAFAALALFAAQPAEAQSLPYQGTVAEVINTSSYTYVRVISMDQKMEHWLAVPVTKVPVGVVVRFGKGAVMRNFASKGADKTFDVILFLGGLEISG